MYSQPSVTSVAVDVKGKGPKTAQHFRLVVIGSQVNAQVIMLEPFGKKRRCSEGFLAAPVKDGNVLVVVQRNSTIEISKRTHGYSRLPQLNSELLTRVSQFIIRQVVRASRPLSRSVSLPQELAGRMPAPRAGATALPAPSLGSKIIQRAPARWLTGQGEDW
jgi:hypothetical protein